MSHPILHRIARAVDAARSLPAMWSARLHLRVWHTLRHLDWMGVAP